MPTTAIHSGIRVLMVEQIEVWKKKLTESNDSKISDLAETLSSCIAVDLFLPLPTRQEDNRVPDFELDHECKRAGADHCRYPGLVLEVEFSKTKEELCERAEVYSM